MQFPLTCKEKARSNNIRQCAWNVSESFLLHNEVTMSLFSAAKRNRLIHFQPSAAGRVTGPGYQEFWRKRRSWVMQSEQHFDVMVMSYCWGCKPLNFALRVQMNPFLPYRCRGKHNYVVRFRRFSQQTASAVIPIITASSTPLWDPSSFCLRVLGIHKL